MKKIIVLLLFTLYSSFFNLSSAQIIYTVAGNGADGYSGDGGQATAAEFYLPCGIALDDSGNIYVADELNNRIRKVTLYTGIISTVAGGGFSSNNGDGGPATNAELVNPEDVKFDKAGNMYIADYGENEVRKVTTSTGIIITIAGNGYIDYFMGLPNGWGAYAGNNGQATNAELNGPSGVAIDDSNNIYIADAHNNVIRKVTVSTGIITTVVGNGYGASNLSGGGFSGEGGPATNAELNYPTAVTVDSLGNIYIADCINNEIRKVTYSTGIIIPVAGHHAYGRGYSGDGGFATTAELYYPNSITFDKFGNLFLSDGWNNVVRMVTKSTGFINTIAGDGYLATTGYGGYSGDGGLATAAEFTEAEGIVFDSTDNLYIVDGGNNRIRKVIYDTNTITGINGLKAKSEEVSVFPNPNNGTFILSFSNINQKCNIDIYNILGGKVYSKLSTVNFPLSINLSGQPDGVYLYRVLKEGGSLIGEGKVVIEK